MVGLHLFKMLSFYTSDLMGAATGGPMVRRFFGIEHGFADILIKKTEAACGQNFSLPLAVTFTSPSRFNANLSCLCRRPILAEHALRKNLLPQHTFNVQEKVKELACSFWNAGAMPNCVIGATTSADAETSAT
jgi:hypothetical protein